MNRTLISTINQGHLNQIIEVAGWIRKIRKLGSLIFIDIIDRFDLLQVVVQKNFSDFDKILHLPKETVVKVTGQLVLRKDPNPELKTGKYELLVQNFEVLNLSTKEPPLIIQDATDANEDVRLKYRYLDLRRPKMQKMLQFRSNFIFAINKYLIEHGFINVETPNLTKITPEGANGFILPYRKKAGTFYTLDQSPQIYKQLLMLSGLQKYFQIAKCFRDEDMRLDRQPEFTQLDVEMSFVTQQDIMNLTEDLIKTVIQDTLNIKLNDFEVMNYDTAINDYGSDKPDLRLKNKLEDVTFYFVNSKLNVLKSSNNSCLQACYFDGVVDVESEQIDFLTKLAKDKGAKGLIWLVIKDQKLQQNNVIAKKIEPTLLNELIAQKQWNNGLILMVNDQQENAKKALGNVRFQALRTFNLVDPKNLKFVWITNFPLFEYGEEAQRYVAAHHPFTAPTNDWLNNFDQDLKNAKADAYDIVLNGFEVGGGSIRIHDKNVQHRLFQALGMNETEINNKFGFLLEAFNYGVPPHGGIALGLDRLIMLLLNTDSIREVIAFPKNSLGIDLMLEAPNSISDNELKKYHIKVTEEGK